MPHAACREQVEGFLDSLCDERVVSEFADWYVACCSSSCVSRAARLCCMRAHTQCCTLHAACLHGACYTVRSPSAAHAHRTARRIAAEGHGAPIDRSDPVNRIGGSGASRPHEAVRTMRMAVRSKEKLAAVRTSLGEAAGAAGSLRLT